MTDTACVVSPVWCLDTSLKKTWLLQTTLNPKSHAGLGLRYARHVAGYFLQVPAMSLEYFLQVFGYPVVHVGGWTSRPPANAGAEGASPRLTGQSNNQSTINIAMNSLESLLLGLCSDPTPKTHLQRLPATRVVMRCRNTQASKPSMQRGTARAVYQAPHSFAAAAQCPLCIYGVSPSYGT